MPNAPSCDACHHPVGAWFASVLPRAGGLDHSPSMPSPFAAPRGRRALHGWRHPAICMLYVSVCGTPEYPGSLLVCAVGDGKQRGWCQGQKTCAHGCTDGSDRPHTCCVLLHANWAVPVVVCSSALAVFQQSALLFCTNWRVLVGLATFPRSVAYFTGLHPLRKSEALTWWQTFGQYTAMVLESCAQACWIHAFLGPQTNEGLCWSEFV
jgi:hypothetical protein